MEIKNKYHVILMDTGIFLTEDPVPFSEAIKIQGDARLGGDYVIVIPQYWTK